MRLVFVVRSIGLRPWGIVPQGLELYGQDRHQQKTLFEKSLTEHTLHPSMSALEPLKHRLTIIQDLSGRAAAASDPHGANFGALGVYRSDVGASPVSETIDAALAKALPGIFPHLGFKMGVRVVSDHR
jgi:hypothetical protein